MRMTKRNKELLRLYQRERARGFQAKWALSNARTRLEWEKHEVAEYSSGEAIDPKRGDVRLRIVPDETCSLEDLEGDSFNPKANPDIPASRLQRDREDFIAKVNREGVWGIVGEYFDGEWQPADSCFGFVGDDWKHSGYDTDIMRATLDAAAKHDRVMKKPDINRVLLQTLREELDALRIWQGAPELTGVGDVAEGIAISISKIEAAIHAAERKKY